MREGTKATTSQAQSHIIKRPRLTKLLDDSGAKLILLVAPAGYGKTTLAREWTSAYRRPLAWYQASASSADVAALAAGLAVELDTAAGDGTTLSVDRVAALARYEQRPDVLARALARSREWPRGLIIVIDDYHRIATSEAAAELVGRLTALVPAVFLIASRTRPSWFAARQTVYGEAVEIGTHELAMTSPEAHQVFASSPESGIQSLLEIARGWPVVIGLAARTGRTEFPSQPLPRRLYEYLADDLIETTSHQTQHALTVLALSGVKDRVIAKELIGPNIEAAIHEAEARGLITTDESTQLILHPLLGEYLIGKLRETPARNIVRPLAEALIRRRRWDECLNVAEALPEEFTFVGRVLDLALQDLLRSGRFATIRRWLQVARGLELDEPIFDLAEGEIALRDGVHLRAIALGARASRRYPNARDLRAQAQVLAGRAAHLVDQPNEARRMFRAAELATVSPQIRADALWGQFIVAYEHEAGEMDHALQQFGEMSDGTVGHEVRHATGTIMTAMRKGSITRAADHVEPTLACVPSCDDPLLSHSALNICAAVLVDAAAYDRALAISDQLVRDALESGITFAVSHGLVTSASALTGLRRFAAARRTCSQLQAHLDEEPYAWATSNLAIQQARLDISLNDLDRAAERLIVNLKGSTFDVNRAEYLAYRALIEAARNRPNDAVALAERAVRISGHAEPYGVACVAHAMLGIGGQEGCSAETLKYFACALECGHLDAIVVGCRAQPELAKRIVQHGEHRDVLRAILIASNDEPIARSAGLDIPRTNRRAEALSPRELEVYELMVEGRTNGEIARTLFITESTAKVHVRHVFEKLGVRSRVEAVRAWPAFEAKL